ncbi:MAG: hypothetical protein L6R42_011437, partial [Xanthoria sp. 1 TBL-2021]
NDSAYFIKARQAGRPVVKDLPKFDLDQYIANYRGTMLSDLQCVWIFTVARENAI